MKKLELLLVAIAAVLLADAIRSVSWTTLLAVVLLSWVTIALAVGTIVGHGIAFGTGSDFD